MKYNIIIIIHIIISVVDWSSIRDIYIRLQLLIIDNLFHRNIIILSDKICYYLNLLVTWVYLLLYELNGLLVDFEFWGEEIEISPIVIVIIMKMYCFLPNFERI